jgi:hypothetical protein
MKALREEVLKAIKIDIWKPINPNTLMEEQLKLILPQMLVLNKKIDSILNG